MSDFDNLIDEAMEACVDQFGDVVSYIPEGSETRHAVHAIFDEAQTVIDTSGEAPVETRAPVLSVRLSEFDKLGVRRPDIDDHFVINGKIYIVVLNPQDGWSESRLVLQCEGEDNA